MVISSIYRFNVIGLAIENHHVIKCFVRWVDGFTTPAVGENLGNFTRFMTDFSRHSTGFSNVSNLLNFPRTVDEFKS